MDGDALLDAPHVELDDDEARLLALFRDLRPASRFHLLQALAARETPGITGTLIVKIPRKPDEVVDVAFVGGDAELRLKM